MNWEHFLKDVHGQSVIESQFLHLLYGYNGGVELQLSRWKKQGKIHQLKRGYYILDEVYSKVQIFEPYIASILKFPSYVSLEKALEMHHLIPDVIYTFTSVTTKRRPNTFVNPVGCFKYFSIKKEYFWGYQLIKRQELKGYLAEPEKALIDLLYFHKKKVDETFIDSLRLQNTDKLDREKLILYARKMGISFIEKGVELLLDIIKEG